jgi:uncharacterized protein YciI
VSDLGSPDQSLPRGTGLGKRLYVILSRPTARGAGRDAVRGEHRNYIDRLEREGVLFAAGPEVDESDKSQGPGIIIIRAASIAQARAIADSEPFHRDGFREYEIRTWRISEGGFSLNVRFSDKSVDIA